MPLFCVAWIKKKKKQGKRAERTRERADAFRRVFDTCRRLRFLVTINEIRISTLAAFRKAIASARTSEEKKDESE